MDLAFLKGIEFIGGVKNIASILFAVFLVFFWIEIFVILYHLIRFGIGRIPKQLSLVVILGSLFLSLLATILYFIFFL